MSSYYDLNGPQRLTVLVVDDSPAILTIFGELLAPFYNVRVASSGKRALELVETAPTPDIILLDVLMPDMDGYAVLKSLQDNPRHRDIPVILVTSLEEHENEEIGLAKGAVDFFHKPIKPALLLARIKTYLTFMAERNALVDQIDFLQGEIRRMAAEIQAPLDRAKSTLQPMQGDVTPRSTLDLNLDEQLPEAAAAQGALAPNRDLGIVVHADPAAIPLPELDRLSRIPASDDHESLCLC